MKLLYRLSEDWCRAKGKGWNATWEKKMFFSLGLTDVLLCSVNGKWLSMFSSSVGYIQMSRKL